MCLLRGTTYLLSNLHASERPGSKFNLSGIEFSSHDPGDALISARWPHQPGTSGCFADGKLDRNRSSSVYDSSNSFNNSSRWIVNEKNAMRHFWNFEFSKALSSRRVSIRLFSIMVVDNVLNYLSERQANFLQAYSKFIRKYLAEAQSA